MWQNNITNLVWMFDMNTKPELFQYSPFSFDNLGFQSYVVLVKNHRLDSSESTKPG